MSDKDNGILIVEDNMLLSLVYENYIKKLGHTPLGPVTTGEEAVELAKKHNPALIIMDILLDGPMDGIDAMKEIRKFSDVAVIYITGNSDNRHAIRAEETNYVDYLIKPITINDLKSTFEKVFSESDS
ncbi:MAG TPA: response regulator [Balneolales bacterium]|nr:response regulator [Balneolales bacterium]